MRAKAPKKRVARARPVKATPSPAQVVPSETESADVEVECLWPNGVATGDVRYLEKGDRAVVTAEIAKILIDCGSCERV